MVRTIFDGEVEPCINGKAVALGAYFGQNVDGIVERLLGEQLADGGWNCEAERGSIRSSFNSTIAVLEGLLEYERPRELPGRSRSPAQRCRNISSSDGCSAAYRPARSSILPGPSSHSPPVGTTTSYEDSTTSEAPASNLMRDVPRRSTSWRARGTRTDDGLWRTPIPVEFTSTWTRATASRAVGTPFGPCACSPGPDAHRHDRTVSQRHMPPAGNQLGPGVR